MRPIRKLTQFLEMPVYPKRKTSHFIQHSKSPAILQVHDRFRKRRRVYGRSIRGYYHHHSFAAARRAQQLQWGTYRLELVIQSTPHRFNQASTILSPRFLAPTITTTTTITTTVKNASKQLPPQQQIFPSPLSILAFNGHGISL